MRVWPYIIVRRHTYDCLYLALAEAAGHVFVTADERLCAKVLARKLPVQVLELDAAAALAGGSRTT